MPPAAPRPDTELIATLEEAHYHPLWDRYKRITPVQPAPRDTPMHWPWSGFEPFVARAAAEVPIEDVERRAIIMAHPAFGGETVTTTNLIAAFTILEPGDHAVPHRHTASAIRFSTRAEGAVTIVNGRRCEMHEGDLVLTPPLCWHGHINESAHRTVWFDAANMPLVCGLDASFFEPGRRDDGRFWKVDAGAEGNWTAAGMMPVGARPTVAHSPKYRYPGEDARRLLDGMSAAADGSKLMRYVNPLTAGPVMPMLDCYRLRLAGGAATAPQRGTYNRVCLVVNGNGRSTVGGRTFEWARHDVFTIPHWTWASHTALGGDADVFIVSDYAVLEAMGLLREEMQ